MGEGQEGGLKLHFDGHLRLEFRGAKVTTDAGLLAVRELDETLVLTKTAGEMISDMRIGTYKSQSQDNTSPCTTLRWFPFVYVSLWRTPPFVHTSIGGLTFPFHPADLSKPYYAAFGLRAETPIRGSQAPV